LWKEKPAQFLSGDTKLLTERGVCSLELLSEFLEPKFRKPRAALVDYERQLQKAAMVIKHVNVERGTLTSRGTISVALYLHAHDEQARVFISSFDHANARPRAPFPLREGLGEGHGPH
jgi:hypothetical protein